MAAPNHLQRQFNVAQPHQSCVTDPQRLALVCAPPPVPGPGCVLMNSNSKAGACAATSSDTKTKRTVPPCRPWDVMPFLPCYSCAAAPVKCSRDWRPVESPRRKPWSLFRRVCGFLVCAPVYGGSDGGAKAPPVLAGGSRYANLFEPPPSIGVGCGGFSKPNHLESTMAQSFPARISAPTSPIGGTAPIQLNADAHHARNRAAHRLPALRNLWLMEASS